MNNSTTQPLSTGHTLRPNIVSGRRYGRRYEQCSAVGLDGPPIPPLGLRRIEAAERRVDVDDLMALAVALGVSPVTLLMPEAGSAEEEVSATGLSSEVPATELWNWLCADHPVTGHGEDWFQFRMAAWPRWKSGPLSEHVKSAFLAAMNKKATDGDD